MKIIILALMLITLNTYSSEFKKVDIPKFDVTNIRTFDPCYLSMKTSYGEITAGYQTCDDFDLLYSYKEKKLLKNIYITWSQDEGLYLNLKEKKVRLYFKMGDKNKHPLDIFYSECSSANPSTVGMGACAGLSNELWDKELNRSYKNIPKKLKSETKLMQRAWIKYRDTMLDLYKKKYADLEGSFWSTEYNLKELEIIRSQVLLLNFFERNTFGY